MAFFFGVFHVTGAESTSPVFLGGIPRRFRRFTIDLLSLLMIGIAGLEKTSVASSLVWN